MNTKDTTTFESLRQENEQLGKELIQLIGSIPNNDRRRILASFKAPCMTERGVKVNRKLV